MLRRAFSSSTVRLFRAKPEWASAQHFDEARHSLLAHICNTDVDDVEHIFPGTMYKFQYGGYGINELVSPWLTNCSFTKAEDSSRLLGLCFVLDRKFVLRNLPPAPSSALAEAAAALTCPSPSVPGAVQAAVDIAGGTIVCELDDNGYMVGITGTNSVAGPAPFDKPPANCDADELKNWATAECSRYLSQGAKTNNVTVLGNVLVTTRDVTAGETLSCASGLCHQLSDTIESLGGGQVPEFSSVLVDTHAGFIQQERRVMGTTGACERSAVSALGL